MIAKPPHIVPLNVFEDIVRIGQGEMPIDDRLKAVIGRIDQFLVDVEEYEWQYPASHRMNETLKSQLRHRLKAATDRWIGTEAVCVLKAALTWLAGRDDPERDEILH